MRKLKLFKSLLVVATLLVGGTSFAWAQKTTWTYASTGNTFGAEFSGSKSGLVTVQFGATSEASNWEVLYFSNRNRGVHHNTNSVTLSTEEGQTYIPISGTFMIVKPVVDVKFSATIYCYQKSWLYLVDADNGTSRTTITSSRTNNNQQTGTATLTAGKTYYIYGDNGAANWAFVSFTAKTPELVRLETEITSAQGLYDNDAYTEGKTNLNTAIETATTLSTNDAASTDDIVACIKALLEAEGVFLAANGNQNYIVASNEYLYCGRPVKSVKGIVMTYGGKEGTNTWGLSAKSITGTYTGNVYTHGADCGAYGSYNGARCNGTTTVSNLPNQGTYFKFEPTESGVLTTCMLYCSSRNMFLADGDKNTIDYYNPASNYYGERAYKLEAGKTYYLWQDNNTYGKLYGFRFVPADVTKIIGDVNYTTNYALVWNSTPVWINAGETGYYKIKNWNNTESANLYENWYLFAANENSTNLVIFGPNHSNTETNGTYTSKPTFTMADLNGATVELFFKLTDAGNDTYTWTTTAVTTKADGTKLSPDLVYTQTGINVSRLKAYVSVEKSWLEVIDQDVNPTVTATIGANGYSTFASTRSLDMTKATQAANGFKAYSAKVEGTSVTFTQIDQWVNPGLGVLLEGSIGGSVNIPVTYNGNPIENNDFLVNTSGATFDADANFTYYGMMKATTADEPIVFGTFDPSSVAIPADKAYLKVASNNARLTVVFSDEATGIKTVQGEGVKVNGYYDLQGRRVAQPAKGLYIVNGKKMVVK